MSSKVKRKKILRRGLRMPGPLTILNKEIVQLEKKNPLKLWLITNYIQTLVTSTVARFIKAAPLGSGMEN